MAVGLQHIKMELETLIPQAKKKYAEYVKQRRMTPYTRDSKLAVLETLLKATIEAIDKKAPLPEILKQLPT